MKEIIPEDIALQICELIRERNRKKKFSLAKGQCWGCMKYSNKKGDIKTRCLFSSENTTPFHLPVPSRRLNRCCGR